MTEVKGMTAARTNAIKATNVVKAVNVNDILYIDLGDARRLQVKDPLGAAVSLKGLKGDTGDSGSVSKINNQTGPAVVLNADNLSAAKPDRYGSMTEFGIVRLSTNPEANSGFPNDQSVLTASNMGQKVATVVFKGPVELATREEVAERVTATTSVTPDSINGHPGIPWAEHTGQLQSPAVLPATASAVVLTFPTGMFSKAPVVVATLLHNNAFSNIAVVSVTATSCTILFGNLATSGSRVMLGNVLAVQMTP